MSYVKSFYYYVIIMATISRMFHCNYLASVLRINGHVYHKLLRRSLCLSTESVVSEDTTVTDSTAMLPLLDHLNTASPEVISRFRTISHQRAADIVKYRERAGKFRTLSDIENVANIGHKTLMRVIEEYSRNGNQLPNPWPDSGSAKKKYRLERSVIYPHFSASQLPESAVALSVQLDSIYWAKMTEDCILSDWNFLELDNYLHRKYDHVVHTNKLWKALQEIPLGSVYLLEDSFFIPQTKALTSATINKARVDCMLTLCLNLRHHGHSKITDEPPEQVVYKLKTPEIARYFNLLVGKEKVSSHNVAMDIVRQKRNTGHVSVPHEHFQYFSSQPQPKREQLSNCLLQITMFYELLLKQNQDYDLMTGFDTDDDILGES